MNTAACLVLLGLQECEAITHRFSPSPLPLSPHSRCPFALNASSCYVYHVWEKCDHACLVRSRGTHRLSARPHSWPSALARLGPRLRGGFGALLQKHALVCPPQGLFPRFTARCRIGVSWGRSMLSPVVACALLDAGGASACDRTACETWGDTVVFLEAPVLCYCHVFGCASKRRVGCLRNSLTRKKDDTTTQQKAARALKHSTSSHLAMEPNWERLFLGWLVLPT